MEPSARDSSTGPGPGQREALRRRLLAGSAGYVSWKTVTGALGMLAGLFLYRVLGPDQAGRLQLVLALGMTAGSIVGLGFYETLARFVPERSEAEGRGLFRRALTLNGRAVLAGLGVFAVMWVLKLGLPVELRRAGVLFVLYTAAYALYNTCLGMMRGQGRFTLIPRLDLGANFGARVAALALVAVVPGFLSAYAAHVAAQIAMLAVALLLLRPALAAAPVRFRRAESRFGALILVGIVLQLLLSTVDLYVLRILLGPEDVGLFAAGSRIPLMAEQLVLAPIGVPLLYYFSHPETSVMREAVVRRGTRLAGAALGLAALVLVVAARPIILILLGEAYRGSIPVARAYAFHPVGIGLLLFSLPLYGSVSRPEYGIVQGAVTFVLNLGLDLLLVPRYGPLGAAVAGVIAVAVTALGASVFLHARFRVDVRWPVAGILLLYAVGLTLTVRVHPAAGIAAYVLLLWPLRLFRRGDLALLRRRGGTA